MLTVGSAGPAPSAHPLSPPTQPTPAGQPLNPYLFMVLGPHTQPPPLAHPLSPYPQASLPSVLVAAAESQPRRRPASPSLATN